MDTDALYFPKENSSLVRETLYHKNGSVYLREYKRGVIIGKGGFAKCYVVKNMDTGKIYAGKVIDKQGLKERAQQKLLTEIKIHRSLKHPNIVLFKHNFEDVKFVYIILELCKNQTIMELVKRNKRLTEPEVRLYTKQLVSSLKYLHAQQIIHRDLKLGNLFLDHEMNLKLGDFGLATRLSYPTEKKRTICGTPNYIAPEVLNSAAGHSYAADIWSLGVIIYTMVVGKPPFETDNVKTTYSRIKSNIYSFPENILISEKCKSLIRLILHTVPEARPQLDDILEHSFFITSENINVAYETLNKSQATPLEERAKELDSPKGGAKKTPADVAIGDQDLNNSDVEHKPVLAELPIPPDNEANVDNPKKLLAYVKSQDSKENKKLSPSQSINKRDTYITMHHVLEYSITNQVLPSISFPLPDFPLNPNQLWITHFVDYTKKYGMGYMLSNGNIGIYFNDASKFIYQVEENVLEYYERSKSSSDESLVQKFSLGVYPDFLLKKVTLLDHFKSYLLTQKSKNPRVSLEESVAYPYSTKDSMVYVKKWIKTRHAVLFRLSNQSIQISFFDNSEIILTHEARVITFMDKNGFRKTCYLTDLLVSDRQDVIKRLRYTRDILNQLIKDMSSQKSGTTSSGSSSSK